MEDAELKDIWKEYDRKLEEARMLNLQSWALNLRWFETMQQQKMRSKMSWLAFIKVLMILAGMVWIYLLAWLLLHFFHRSSPFFVVSVGAILLFNMYGIVLYLRHLVLIRQINNSESVVGAQLKLAKLQASTLYSMRVLFLQTPFFSTFFYTVGLLHDTWFLLIGPPVTLLLTAASIWLYRNLSSKNMHKKWFNKLLGSPEWTYITRSMGFIEEIEAFKNNL
jgi:hypothetical protein